MLCGNCGKEKYLSNLTGEVKSLHVETIREECEVTDTRTIFVDFEQEFEVSVEVEDGIKELVVTIKNNEGTDHYFLTWDDAVSLSHALQAYIGKPELRVVR